MTQYCQCTLERYSEFGRLITVSYIPKKFAVIGECVKLRGTDGVWRDGYHVTSVGPIVESDYVDGLYQVGADIRKKLK